MLRWWRSLKYLLPMTQQRILPLIAASIVLPAAALAQSYDGFDYTASTALAGNGTGTGWFASSTWTVASGGFNVGSGSLVAGNLTTSGNHVVSTTNGSNIASRRMATAAPSSGEFWASIVVDANGLGGGLAFDSTASTNLNLFSNTFGDRARFGFGINGTNFVYKLDGRETAVINGSVAGATGNPTLLVAKFDVTNGLFSLWADPVLGGANPTGGISIASDVAFVRKGATFASDVSFAGLFANWGGVQLDEVRLGTSFSAVAIPEPSAFAAIAGLAGLGLAATRRRRRA
jgi:MYXO-CTERM domain-containing protein